MEQCSKETALFTNVGFPKEGQLDTSHFIELVQSNERIQEVCYRAAFSRKRQPEKSYASKLTTAKEIKKIDTKTDGISQSFGLDTHNLLEQVQVQGLEVECIYLLFGEEQHSLGNVEYLVSGEGAL